MLTKQQAAEATIENFQRQADTLLKTIITVDKYTLQNVSSIFMGYRKGYIDAVRLFDDEKVQNDLIGKIEEITQSFNEKLREKIKESEYQASAGQYRMFRG